MVEILPYPRSAFNDIVTLNSNTVYIAESVVPPTSDENYMDDIEIMAIVPRFGLGISIMLLPYCS